LELLYEERYIAIVTTTLLLEYESILGRKEHRLVHALSDQQLDLAIRVFAAMMETVHVDFQWRPQLADPDDEFVLEAAINGSAEAIITYNVRDFEPAQRLFGIRVLTPGDIIRERFS
jgi:predicted nucleic acid-binding protein